MSPKKLRTSILGKDSDSCYEVTISTGGHETKQIFYWDAMLPREAQLLWDPSLAERRTKLVIINEFLTELVESLLSTDQEWIMEYDCGGDCPTAHVITSEGIREEIGSLPFGGSGA